MTRRVLAGTCRALVLTFCSITALYAFIASSAFAYRQFIRPRVFWWLGAFSDHHVALSLVCLSALLVVVWPDLRSGSPTARLARPLAGAAAAATAWNAGGGGLASLHEGGWAIGTGIVALLPVLTLAAIDHLRAWPYLSSSRPPAFESQDAVEGRLFVTAIGTAVLVTAVYAVLTTIALGDAFEPDLDSPALVVGAASALVGHLAVFCVVFVCLAATLRLGGRVLAGQYVCLLAAAAILFAAVFFSLAGRAIGLTGASGLVAAAAAGVSVASAWGGLRLGGHAARGAGLVSAIDVFLSPARPGPPDRRTVFVLAALLPAAWLLAWAAAPMDWDFVLLKSGVVIVWVSAFAGVYRAAPPGRRPAWLMLVGCAAPLVVIAAWRPERTHGHAMDRYAVHNPSYRVVSGLLREPRRDSGFDRFLRANTGLTDEVVAPRSIDFVPPAALTPATEPPHVFLFVIDSLRADYLSPYNANAHFTPRIAGFAREGVAFRNAFTAYGGTGMSMPALWAGSVLAHKQYVLPFAPMNALEKLLAANRYERWMTGGYINETLWTPHAGDVRLQADQEEMNFRFCATAEEVAQRLSARPAGARPVFVQTLPQDLHAATIRHAYVPPDRSYPGFDAPYAHQVERIDACFGTFVDRLKQLGLYDNSLIVLTADHGDLLGEDGRWGHSYHLNPEVIQVPLLIHLPRGVAPAVDVDEPVFSIDVTPTIYASLGYDVSAADPLTGRPLARRTAGEPAGEHASGRTGAPEYRVIAASYGAVYAVLSNQGRRLYIADAVQGQAHAYRRESIDDLQWSEVPVDAGRRVLAEGRIRRHVDAINAAWNIDRGF